MASLLPWLAVLLGFCLFLFLLNEIAQRTRAQICEWERYRSSFGDIECTPPPEQGRAEFLAEVQYLASFPDRMHLLDEQLGPKLAQAFALHPAVDKVEEVRVTGPRQVRVRLTYRSLSPGLPAASAIVSNTK